MCIIWKEDIKAEELGEYLVLMGADFVSYFPSIDPVSVSKLAQDELETGDFKIVDVNMKEMLRYIRICGSKEDIRSLEHLLPVRRFHRGRTPGITTDEVMGEEANTEDKFIFKEVTPTLEERKKIVAICVRIGIETVFRYSIYQFEGKVYQQNEG